MKKFILVYLVLVLLLSACNSDFWNKKIDFGKTYKDVKETVNPKVVEKQKKVDTTGLWDSIDTDQVNIKNLDQPIKSSKYEDKLCDLILALPEVKERAKYIEKQTKGKRHLLVWIYNKPKKGENYYWVKAGEDNGTNYVTHFNFYVYPKNNEIRFYDVVNDTVISLTTWRKELQSEK